MEIDKYKTKYWFNGQKAGEVPYINDQVHGVATFWHNDGSLWEISKWHEGELLVRLSFSEGDIPGNAKLEVDLFTNETQIL